MRLEYRDDEEQSLVSIVFSLAMFRLIINLHIEHEPNAMWESVEQKLTDFQISGKHLPHFGPNTISFIGIEDANLFTALISAVRTLVQRYSSEFDKLWTDIEANIRNVSSSQSSAGH